MAIESFKRVADPVIDAAGTVGTYKPPGHELNAICPYFTMFPLQFPLQILQKHSTSDQRVLDPFCGRGTTNFAARLNNLYSVGLDASPVAQAITAAKLVSPSVAAIEAELASILGGKSREERPDDRFWQLAYHSDVLGAVCRLRAALLNDCGTAERIALRALILGALHGPRQLTPGYLSNQAPRTYAPKPGYAVKFWSERNMSPERIDVAGVIMRRARRFYSQGRRVLGHSSVADSRLESAFHGDGFSRPFSWVITSPPYYGMKTYLPDQWLRSWFLGGPDRVDYTTDGQLNHRSPERFATDLQTVWRNARKVCSDDATLVVRFGGICDRRADPIAMLDASLSESGWHVAAMVAAGDAKSGRRQADSFLSHRSKPLVEYDVWAKAA